MYKQDIKLMAFVASAMFWGSGWAADSSVYIDQSGDSATITITQDGAGNVVRGVSGVGTSNTTPAKIYGNNNQITVDQIGTGNTLKLGITSTTGGTTTIPGTATTVANPTIIYSVTGNNAVAEINSNSANTGTSQSNYININQTGDGAITNANVLGANNGIKVVTSGGANNSYTTAVDGDENSQNVSMTGGAGNVANITQTGDGNSVTLTSVGATNTFGITQTGAGSSSIVLSHSGSGNSFTIDQTSSATGNNTLNWAGSGSSNTISITQTQ